MPLPEFTHPPHHARERDVGVGHDDEREPRGVRGDEGEHDGGDEQRDSRTSATPSSIAFTLRKRMVLTMRTAGTRTMASAGRAGPGSCNPNGNRIDGRGDHGPGGGELGRPTKCRLSVAVVV